MAGRITKRTVDALLAGETVWDSELRGFGVRRRGEAPPVYVLKCRIGRGREAAQRWLSIGKHGSPWTPETARIEAKRLLEAAGRGDDPKRHRNPDGNGPTVQALCDAYLKAAPSLVLRGKGRPKKESSIEADRSNIERHIKPLLGSKRAADLDRSAIERFQRDIAEGKSRLTLKTKKRGVARVTGGPGIAARTVAVLGAAFAWGMREGLVSANPVRGVALYKSPSRERFLNGDEMKRLGEALTEAEQSWRHWENRRAHDKAAKRQGENPIAIAALRLLLLTGARKGEVLGLRWSWVDFERSCIRLPDSKTGAKVIPLGAPALKVLEGLPRIEGNPFVFPGDKPKAHLVGLPHIWSRLKALANLSDVRLHDLRHSFASVAVAGGDSLFLVGKVLGHTQAKTTERYSHIQDDPLRSVANRAATRIEAAMTGKSGAIVRLKRR